MKNMLKKKGVVLLIIIVMVILGIQLIRPTIHNPPVTGDVAVPDPIRNMLRTACYDCHSNETKLSWFDKITPVNFTVADHIKKGRAALNFSEWDKLSKDQQKAALFESLNQMEFRLMPLPQYENLHPSAKIDSVHINLFKSYLRTLFLIQSIDTGKINAANREYKEWMMGTITLNGIVPSLNKIQFIPGYKNWVAINSSERLDNGTMRIIAGNEIALAAIKAKHTNPWPDGAAFAKIIWYQALDSTGIIHPGEFKQVDFMMKDKTTFAATQGWGYARWLGKQLKPYGKNAIFATECANCHNSMKDLDYVFTVPVAGLTDHQLQDKVVTSFVNHTDGTMSILYGNAIAADFSRTHTGNRYPSGSVLTLVTWEQQQNSHWFGGVNPGSIQSIEKLQFSDSGSTDRLPFYERMAGNPLKRTDWNSIHQTKDRIDFILDQRASVMP